MIITQTPQFLARNEHGPDDGIAPIPRWYEASSNINDSVPTVLHTPTLANTSYPATIFTT
jgi:hypothetical protein